MAQTDELIRDIAEAWLVRTRPGGDAKFVTLLASTLTSAEVSIAVEAMYRTRYLSPVAQIDTLHAGTIFGGFLYLCDGTRYDQVIGTEDLEARHAYDIQLWLRPNGTVYLRWRQKNATREWDHETQESWTSEWWEEDLTLDLDAGAWQH